MSQAKYKFRCGSCDYGVEEAKYIRAHLATTGHVLAKDCFRAFLQDEESIDRAPGGTQFLMVLLIFGLAGFLGYWVKESVEKIRDLDGRTDAIEAELFGGEPGFVGEMTTLLCYNEIEKPHVGDWLHAPSGRKYEVMSIHGDKLECLVHGRHEYPKKGTRILLWHWNAREEESK